MSADSLGAHLSFSTGAGNNFISRYDTSGNYVWSFQIPAPRPSGTTSGIPISTGENEVFVGGSASDGIEAYISAFSESSSLVLFGLNPPYSFEVVALLLTTATLGVLWYRR